MEESDLVLKWNCVLTCHTTIQSKKRRKKIKIDVFTYEEKYEDN